LRWYSGLDVIDSRPDFEASHIVIGIALVEVNYVALHHTGRHAVQKG